MCIYFNFSDYNYRNVNDRTAARKLRIFQDIKTKLQNEIKDKENKIKELEK
jgi:hypothetical protein